MFLYRSPDGFELRLLEERHATDMFTLVDNNREYLRQWLPWLDTTTSVDDSRAFIRQALHLFAENGAWTGGIWSEGSLMGSIGCHRIDDQRTGIEIGYWLAERATGRGLMTRACQAAIQYAFSEMQLHTVEIHCAVDNLASRAIPERLGFEQIGLLHQTEWLYDHFVDHVVYRMSRER